MASRKDTRGGRSLSFASPYITAGEPFSTSRHSARIDNFSRYIAEARGGAMRQLRLPRSHRA